MVNPFKKFANPKKYAEKIDIKKVISVPKVYRKGVERYKKIILSGKPVRPIILLKHPTEDLYAVLDGHHRFYAYLELGFPTVDAVVVKSHKHLFDMTEKGVLQPTPRMTKFIRVPVLIFSKYVNKFIKTPFKLLKSTERALSKVRFARLHAKKNEIENISGQNVNQSQ
jgi:hypothetical protein